MHFENANKKRARLLFPMRMCDLIVWFEYNQTNIYIYVTYVHLWLTYFVLIYRIHAVLELS